MEEVIQLVRNAVQLFVEKVTLLYRTAPTGALQLTGVLGLAAVVVGYIHLRGNSNRSNGTPTSNLSNGTRNTASSSSQAAGSAAASRSAPVAAQAVSAPAKSNDHGLVLTERGRVIRKQLFGVKKVSLSTLGVLFRERTAKDLQDGAQIIDAALEVLKEMLLVADVYLITHVVDDVGEAVILGALEASGLLGHVCGKLKPHKLLFCSTAEGKVSIVRQLESDLHIDGDQSTVDDLKRFMPQLLQVHPAGATDTVKAPNVGTTASLSDFFS